MDVKGRIKNWKETSKIGINGRSLVRRRYNWDGRDK
jgi:hypothetical protein